MADSERDRLSFQRTPQPIALPSVKVADPGLQSFLDAMKAAVEALANGRGGIANQAITWGAAYRQGLVVLRDTQGNPIRPPGGGGVPVEPPDGPISDIPPPAPTGVVASGGLGVILLSWNAPDSRRVAYAEIFAAATDNIGAAVKIGETFGSTDVTYRDVVGSAATRYYWVRFVGWGALALRGPFQSTAGILGQTSADPAYLLDLLTGAISESELANTLATRIDLIDAPASTALSVNQRIESGDNALSQQIALLTAGANQTFDQFKLWAFDANAESWTATNATLAWVAGWLTYTSASGVVSLTSPTLVGDEIVNGSAYQQVRFRLKRKAGTGWGVTLRWYRSATWYSVTVPDATIADEATETVLVDLSANADWIGQSISRIELQLDSDTGSVYELDWIAVGRDGPGASYAALQQEITTRANETTALAQDVTTLEASVDGKATIVALQDEASVRATNDGYLYAQKFVKIDVNGFVTGYGIAASNNGPTGTPESEFIARVNRFAIVPPTGATGATAPFYFQATPTTINGVPVPAGLYVNSAFIADGSIARAKIGLLQVDDARIADLTVDKLLSGDIQVGRYIQSTGFAAGSTGWRIQGDGTAEFAAASIRGQLTAAQIDSRNLTIRDANGVILFGAGTALNWGNIVGQPSGIYNSNISITSSGALIGGGGGQVSLGGLGAGAMAFINQITAGNAATYIGPQAIVGNLVALGTLTADRFTTNLRTDQATLIRNSDFTDYAGTNSGIAALPGWSLYTGTLPANRSIARNHAGGRFWNVGRGGAVIYYNQSGYTGETGIYQRVAVAGSVAYEFHFAGSLHRTNARIAIDWYASGNTYITQSSHSITSGVGTSDPYAPPIIGWFSVTSPSNAVEADVYIIATSATGSDSYLFMHRVHFAPMVAGASATNPTPWRPAGSVEIHGGAIVAETVDVTSLKANSVTAVKIAADALRSNDFNGTLDADGTISADGTAGWAIGKAGRAVFSNVKVRGDVQATSLNGQIVGTGNIAAGAATVVAVGSVGNATPSIWDRQISAVPSINGRYIFSNVVTLNVQVEPGDVLLVHALLRGTYSNPGVPSFGFTDVLIGTDVVRPGSGKVAFQPSPTYTTGNLALEGETWEAAPSFRNVRFFVMPYEYTAVASETVTVHVGGGLAFGSTIGDRCTSSLKVRVERIRR